MVIGNELEGTGEKRTFGGSRIPISPEDSATPCESLPMKLSIRDRIFDVFNGWGHYDDDVEFLIRYRCSKWDVELDQCRETFPSGQRTRYPADYNYRRDL